MLCIWVLRWWFYQGKKLIGKTAGGVVGGITIAGAQQLLCCWLAEAKGWCLWCLA
jgi:hypothetical protein